MEQCIFCKEINNDGETNFSKLYPKFQNRILHETKNFMLKPALGQIAYGHSMIIPKKHYLSIKEAILEFGTDEIKEILYIYKNYFDINKKNNHFFIYEHGSSKIQNNNSCIEHAHLNIIPLANKEILDVIINNENEYSSGTIDSIYKTILLKRSYIMFAMEDKYYFKYVETIDYQSQYFRRILAKYLKIKEWNWKKFKSQNIFEEFLISFKDYHDKY